MGIRAQFSGIHPDYQGGSLRQPRTSITPRHLEKFAVACTLLLLALAATTGRVKAQEESWPYYVVRRPGGSGNCETLENREYNPSHCYQTHIDVSTYNTTVWDDLIFCGITTTQEVRFYVSGYAAGFNPRLKARFEYPVVYGFNHDNIAQCTEREPPAPFYTTIITPTEAEYLLYSTMASLGNSDCAEIEEIAQIDTVVCIQGQEWEPPPVTDFCTDGTEVLTETVLLSVGEAWTANAETDYPRLYARYTFTEPGENGLLHYIDIRANDEQVTRRYYGDEMQSWDPVSGWTNSGYSFSVPNVENTNFDDYDPTAFVEGPEVSLYASAGYNPLNLVSVCLVPVYTSEFCSDGIEALEAGPVYLSYAGGNWERELTDEISGTTHFVVRYRVANPTPEGGGGIDPGGAILGKFMPQIQANFYYVESPIAEVITFTLPITGVLPLVDDSLWLRFYNRYDAVLLESVCVIDGSEEYMNQLTAEDCHLNNPDFIHAPTSEDWSTEGDTEWSALLENGGMFLDDGLVFQTPLQGQGNIWQMEVRARSATNDDMSFGTSRTGLLDRGPQMKTEELDAQMALYRNNIFVMPEDYVVVQSDQAAIDYVCLMERTGLFDVVDCEGCFPEWNPSGSGDPLLTYLINHLSMVVWCFYCKLVQFLAVVANTLWMMLEDILLRIPALPNVLSDNFWGELMTFLRLALEGFFDWINQFFFPDIQEWLLNVIEDLGRWLAWQWRRLGQWFSWLLYDIVVWLSQQFGVTPQEIFDLLYDIGYELRMFILEIRAEIANETANALHLFVNAVDVLIILVNGVREGVSGETIAYIGEDFTGIGAFIWDGVEFVNDAVNATPLSALNIVALGVLAIGLVGWSGQKFMRMLESFS